MEKHKVYFGKHKTKGIQINLINRPINSFQFVQGAYIEVSKKKARFPWEKQDFHRKKQDFHKNTQGFHEKTQGFHRKYRTKSPSPNWPLPPLTLSGGLRVAEPQGPLFQCLPLQDYKEKTRLFIKNQDFHGKEQDSYIKTTGFLRKKQGFL